MLYFNRVHSLLPDLFSPTDRQAVNAKSITAKYRLYRAGKSPSFVLDQLNLFPDYTRVVGANCGAVLQARVETFGTQRYTFIDLLEVPDAGRPASALATIRRRFLYADDHPLNIVSASLNQNGAFLTFTTAHWSLPAPVGAGADPPEVRAPTFPRLFSRPKPPPPAPAAMRLHFESVLVYLNATDPTSGRLLSAPACVTSLRRSENLQQVHFLPDPVDAAYAEQRLWALAYEENVAIQIVRVCGKICRPTLLWPRGPVAL